MKEVRLHGRGGQGAVKAAQTLVQSLVEQGKFAQFIPFFGVERKGSPVYGFLRIDEKPIRAKTQVYDPHCLLVLDDTLLESVPVFDGLREGGILVINSRMERESFGAIPRLSTVGIVDATGIAEETVGRNMPPNTAVLGAFAKVTGWVDWTILQRVIESKFGKKNLDAARKAYENTSIHECQRGG
ncbi:MAG TPA: 2-oxoacid:acceptor oxidoreductase family protein [Selenomonadales bacterium]|nr:2-oxoacid:acceptor oxidoreductase family protein [Selenomonadales bacterium]